MINKFIKKLKKSGLPSQTIKTLRGQAINGDLEGAMKGFERLVER